MAQNALELYKRIKSDPELNPLEADPRLSAWTKAAQQPAVVSEYQATQQPIEDRAFLFPLGTYADGSVHAAWPGIVAEPAQSWVNMVDRARAGVDDVQADARDAFNVAGSVGLGSLAATPLKPTNALAAMGGKGIRAYHGSPYDFDKFDLSKIGTGEGAQVYGHGLYFAENPKVAQSYRDALVDPDQYQVLINEKKIPSVWNEDLRETFPEMYKGLNVDDQDTLDALLGTMYGSTSIQSAKNAAESVGGNALNLFYKKVKPFLTKPDLGKGHMYEVNINADPEQFLDWDIPLTKQNDYVRNAFVNTQTMKDPILKELVDLSPEGMLMQGILPHAKGSSAYQTIAEDVSSPKVASDRLRETGIKGIRYLDQGSRTAGEGSRNYVVFDDKIIDILRKYGILAPFAGSQVYDQLEPSNALEQ